MTKIVPRVRFEGFTDDWERLKLGEVVEIKDSARISNTLWVSKGVPYLRSSDLVNDGTLGELFISDETYQSYKDKTGAPEKDDVLFTSGGKVGVTYHKIDDDPVYVQGGSILYAKTSKSSKLSGMYLKAFFGSPAMTKYIEGASTGVTLKHFTLKPANAAPIFLSSLKEQNKIGELFNQLDDIIALHQCMLEQKKSFKKTMLQKMFPQKGQHMPKVRFDGFSGEWEEKTIHEIVNGCISDGDWIEKEHIFEQGEYRIIQTGNLGIGEFIDKNNNAKFFHQKDFDELKANEIFSNDILISRLAEPAGRTIILPETGNKMVTAVDVTIIRPNDNFDSYFFVTSMNSERNLSKIAPKVTGTSHRRISRKNLENILLSIPSIEEQRKIGSLFRKMDETITLHKQKIEQYKELKKALLQRMFV